ncbi:hypothetical protein ACTMU2_08585 [Cupriavidus basilensis]
MPWCFVALAIQWLANKILGANLITPAKAIATNESCSRSWADPALRGVHGRAAVAVQPDRGLGRQLVRAAQGARRHGLQPAPALMCWASNGALRVADFWKRNMSGISGQCVALGFLLGLGPEILSFFGPQAYGSTARDAFDGFRRHGARRVLGLDALRLPSLWLAVAGIALMGVLNVG